MNNTTNIKEIVNPVIPPIKSFCVIENVIDHKDNTTHIAIKKKIKVFIIYLRYLV